MKKLFILIALLGLLSFTDLKADIGSFEDWLWINGDWYYIGTDPLDPPLPPPPIRQ